MHMAGRCRNSGEQDRFAFSNAACIQLSSEQAQTEEALCLRFTVEPSLEEDRN